MSLAPSLKVEPPSSQTSRAPSDRMYEEYIRRKKLLDRNKFIIFGVIAALTIWSLWGTGFQLISLVIGTYNMFVFLVTDFFPPDVTVIGKLIGPALDTLYMSYVGMVISVVLSLILGVLAAKNISPNIVLAKISQAVTAFLRSVPAVVWGILLVASIGLGPLTGTIAIGLSGIGILGKAYAEALESIDSDQLEGVRATGANWFQVMGQAVWPQFKASFVSWSLYKLDMNIREAAILGLVGAGGLGYYLQGSLKLFQYKEAAMSILMIFALILLVEFITAKLRERIL
ncbi:phosphonate ABC transporter, permease protein PhnE [Halalkalibacter alkaliphilus]|uniref:Phosphonate ABC transporter, permease protein PhnE n=1 Tax=Halalkalibacter alkaliphilus TaxID=2917993 RepID=A0A9X1ZY46_9BACI|nr:phosphonate ABC transporter, permease protein PhnE [Halalkalibacter alkaliphilus]MCL7746853.1 phosphonate ABC transporter, permease protein PhnE [Halalkalibacter alkaliphilus]